MPLVNIKLYNNFRANEAPFAIAQSSFIENRIWPGTVYGLKTEGEKSYMHYLPSNVPLLGDI
jgi:hypothetical protein